MDAELKQPLPCRAVPYRIQLYAAAGGTGECIRDETVSLLRRFDVLTSRATERQPERYRTSRAHASHLILPAGRGPSRRLLTLTQRLAVPVAPIGPIHPFAAGALILIPVLRRRFLPLLCDSVEPVN